MYNLSKFRSTRDGHEIQHLLFFCQRYYSGSLIDFLVYLQVAIISVLTPFLTLYSSFHFSVLSHVYLHVYIDLVNRLTSQPNSPSLFMNAKLPLPLIILIVSAQPSTDNFFLNIILQHRWPFIFLNRWIVFSAMVSSILIHSGSLGSHHSALWYRMFHMDHVTITCLFSCCHMPFMTSWLTCIRAYIRNSNLLILFGMMYLSIRTRWSCFPVNNKLFLTDWNIPEY